MSFSPVQKFCSRIGQIWDLNFVGVANCKLPWARNFFGGNDLHSKFPFIGSV